jgi:hypothetical protein
MGDIWSSFLALRQVWISGWREQALSHLRPARAIARGCSSGWLDRSKVSWRSGQIADLRPAFCPKPQAPSCADRPGEAQ